MAVDFGILERTPTIGSRFMEGQQAAQQQAERNMLRQMQMQQMAIQQENMLAQREERLAQSEERRARVAQAQAAEARLAQFGTAWKQLTGRDELTEDDVRQIEGAAFASRDPNAMTLAKGLRADLTTRAENRRVAGLFGPQEMPTGAPTVAPAAPAETPVNALAAPAAMPTAPAAAAAPPALGTRRETVRIGGRDFTEQELLQLSADPNPRVQAAAKAGLDLMKANKPPADEAMMTRLGIPLTPEGFAQYKSFGQQPAADIQGYTLAKSQGYAGSYEDWVRMKAREGAARVSNINKINAFEPASEQAQKDYIKGVADERKQLRSATDTLSNLAAAKKLIPSASAFMGPAGESLQKTASFLNERLGFAINTEGVRDAEVLRTRLFQGVLDNLKRLDSQPSQEQQRVLQQAFGTLGTSPDALPLILDRIEESIRNRVDAYNIDVSDAEQRGVKFPFKPQIKLPPPAPPLEIPRQTPPPSRAAPAAAAAAAPAPARTLTPQDRQALEWANKNASDPRAAEIKRRLGQ